MTHSLCHHVDWSSSGWLWVGRPVAQGAGELLWGKSMLWRKKSGVDCVGESAEAIMGAWGWIVGVESAEALVELKRHWGWIVGASALRL